LNELLQVFRVFLIQLEYNNQHPRFSVNPILFLPDYPPKEEYFSKNFTPNLASRRHRSGSRRVAKFSFHFQIISFSLCGAANQSNGAREHAAFSRSI
jgi:hypothetical protein